MTKQPPVTATYLKAALSSSGHISADPRSCQVKELVLLLEGSDWAQAALLFPQPMAIIKGNKTRRAKQWIPQLTQWGARLRVLVSTWQGTAPSRLLCSAPMPSPRSHAAPAPGHVRAAPRTWLFRALAMVDTQAGTPSPTCAHSTVPSICFLTRTYCPQSYKAYLSRTLTASGTLPSWQEPRPRVHTGNVPSTPSKGVGESLQLSAHGREPSHFAIWGHVVITAARIWHPQKCVHTMIFKK